MSKKIGILVGSLRKDSLNKIVAKQLAELFPADYTVSFIEIGDLPVYNEDLEIDGVESYNRFRKEMKEQDAYIFISPEYNRGMPASLKNAIDVGSRPWGESVWPGKPVLVGSVSPAGISGALANHQIRQSLVFGDSPVMAQPELYIDASKAIGEDGKVVSASVAFLQTIADSFVAFINKNSN
ncbi:NADPH-dependent FMN reductase [Carnobacterium maltaromaticum]|uniref:NADPH-dependent FMN reductase n=1 Tax=Carnobacterium maltaromaticum TaxID=2751 RepID=UPI00165A6672|nr:NAD(P)H-dependent oxidoreductase [Carnobacterium maltaromaticum]MBC9809662.1 NADPH-dependent FMN reductase [Carnobacterium maltaromaticum]